MYNTLFPALPVLLVVAFGVVVDRRALLLPDVIVDDVAAVLARVRGPRISVRGPRIGNPGLLGRKILSVRSEAINMAY